MIMKIKKRKIKIKIKKEGKKKERKIKEKNNEDEYLAVVDDDELPQAKGLYFPRNNKTFIGFPHMNGLYIRYNESLDIAVLINMDKKKCKFYDYEKRK